MSNHQLFHTSLPKVIFNSWPTKLAFLTIKIKRRKGEWKKLDQIFIFFSSFVSVSHETRAPSNIATSESLETVKCFAIIGKWMTRKCHHLLNQSKQFLSVVKSQSCTIYFEMVRDNNFKAVLQNPDLMHFSYGVLIAIWRPIQVWLKSLFYFIV